MTEREQYFGVYAGLPCAYIVDTYKTEYDAIVGSEIELSQIEYLELRRPSQLTDEERNKVYEINKYANTSYDSWFVERMLASGENHQKTVDYLRSIGVLTGWRNYSPDDLIRMGWAKVKEV